MDTIDGMKAFVAVARQQSFTSGAQLAGISTKLASKYVRQLEERLAAQLFNRTTRSVVLTDVGTAYFNRCVPLLNQFDELEGLVQERHSELSGTIRMTAPTGFGSTKLVEAVQAFQLANPDIVIELHLSDQHVAVVEEGFDVAIRFGELKDSTLIARKLMTMPLVAYASPEYLADHGTPLHPSELSQHRCLLTKFSSEKTYWKFRVEGRWTSFPVNGVFYANAPRAIAQAAVGGLGIGVSPLYCVEEFLGSGRLIRLFEQEMLPDTQLHAVYPQGRYLIARVRSLIDHLLIAFAPPKAD